MEDALSGHRNGVAILKLVEQKQMMMKDAWLTCIGHKRPKMRAGLPFDEAQQKCAAINKQIKALMEGCIITPDAAPK
ncbi:hypothetical protein SAMN05444274_11454 [Mariniphaga anaerophila]|uniref:Uncharacterized protein n=2 Tax=Mariniphaga anaerophila TaxID=1484053 RepID=A0A1M5FT40_9BACT|nr:hypothetical protein SAMN05444274_11454 [Mariniphaga anaerophila]